MIKKKAVAVIGNIKVPVKPKVVGAKAPVKEKLPTVEKPKVIETVKEETKPCPFAKVEEQILKDFPRPIRLVPLKRKRSESLEEFLEKFYLKFNDELKTIYADTKEHHTDNGKKRSLGDIFMICRYYYPDCKLADILNILYNVLPDKLPAGYRSSYCFGVIHKRTYYFSPPKKKSEVWDSNQPDEFGNKVDFYLKNLKKLYGKDCTWKIVK